MYLTVCPLYGSGHDSSVGELMYLTVCPPCGPGSIPGHGGVFQAIFPRLITLCQPVMSLLDRKWLNLPSMTPHNLWTVRRKARVLPRTDQRADPTKRTQLSTACNNFDTTRNGRLSHSIPTRSTGDLFSKIF